MDYDRYKYVFSVEDVNKLVQQGVPFRDAYKKVGGEINAGTYEPSRSIEHTHAGSIGNLCLEQIYEKMESIVDGFEFKKIDAAYSNLLNRK